MMTDQSVLLKRRTTPRLATAAGSNSNSIGREEKESQTISSSMTESSSTMSNNIENVCWLIASIVCAYYSDIFRVLLNDSRVYRFLMHISFLLIAINLVIAFYLYVWLTRVKKIESSKWSEMYPILIPIATACLISGSILLTISIWPVYTWFSAPLLFIIFMGIIVIFIYFPILI